VAHVPLVSRSHPALGFFRRNTSLGRGSFQLYSCPGTWINRIQQESEGEGTSAPVFVTSIDFCGSCDLITGNPRKDFVVVG